MTCGRCWWPRRRPKRVEPFPLAAQVITSTNGVRIPELDRPEWAKGQVVEGAAHPRRDSNHPACYQISLPTIIVTNGTSFAESASIRDAPKPTHLRAWSFSDLVVQLDG